MSRRTYFRHLSVLLWKNALIKWRTPFTTFFEVALPVIIMALIVAIRSIIHSSEYGVDLHTEDTLAWNDYAAGNVSQTFATWPSARNALHPNTQRIAFVADDWSTLTPIVSNFTALYPILAASVVHYTPSGLEDYMLSSSYGYLGHPYIAAALQVDQVGSVANGWQTAYTIRLNSTQTTDEPGNIGMPDMTQPAYNSLHWTYDSTWKYLVTNGEIFFQSFMESVNHTTHTHTHTLNSLTHSLTTFT